MAQFTLILDRALRHVNRFDLFEFDQFRWEDDA